MTAAWNDVVNKDGSDEWLETCNAAMREVQSVTLHRAIKRLQAGIELSASDVDDRLTRGLSEAVNILTDYRNGL